MKFQRIKILGFCIFLLGVLVIFVSSAINAIYNLQFNEESKLSHEIYIFDLISTIGVILIPLGLSILLRKNLSTRF